MGETREWIEANAENEEGTDFSDYDSFFDNLPDYECSMCDFGTDSVVGIKIHFTKMHRRKRKKKK